MQNPWIARTAAPAETTTQLFCFPHAGAGGSAFRTWQRELGTAIHVNAMQYPGRESRLRESPHISMASLVAALAEALRPELRIPFAFFGHSVGAWIAFEVARMLAATGQPAPAHLFVSGRRSPQSAQRLPNVHELPDEEFLSALSSRYGGIHPEIFRHAELRELLLPALRADLTAAETYTYIPGPLLTSPLSVFAGRDDRSTSLDELEGWRDETTGPFSLDLLPGGHFFLDTARPQLLALIRGRL